MNITDCGYGWHFCDPPTTEDTVNAGSIIWYDVLYDDGSTGKSCWWHDHWYGNTNWTGIIAYKEVTET